MDHIVLLFLKKEKRKKKKKTYSEVFLVQYFKLFMYLSYLLFINICKHCKKFPFLGLISLVLATVLDYSGYECCTQTSHVAPKFDYLVMFSTVNYTPAVLGPPKSATFVKTHISPKRKQRESSRIPKEAFWVPEKSSCAEKSPNIDHIKDSECGKREIHLVLLHTKLHLSQSIYLTYRYCRIVFTVSLGYLRQLWSCS